MRAPRFWDRDAARAPALLLSPAAAIVAAATARRVAKPGWRAPVPVICCGNLTVGGAGKTTVALDLGRRLLARGIHLHFLTRGYRGSARGVHRVQRGDSAAVVGDEALLLAELAPTWVGADRAASARAAVDAGAEALLMDDGLQNPTLRKDLALLVADGATGFGNGFVLPAGPLREPVRAGAARCHAAVMIGEDRAGVEEALAPLLPILPAALAPSAEIAALRGRAVLAVAGLAFPGKFFVMLQQNGVIVAEREPFPDHHPFTQRELDRLRNRAARLNLTLVTTPKDAMRLAPADRACFQVIGVGLRWRDTDRIDGLLRTALSMGDDHPVK